MYDLRLYFMSNVIFCYVFRNKDQDLDMDVSENSGTPKWMVYNGKPYQNG